MKEDPKQRHLLPHRHSVKRTGAPSRWGWPDGAGLGQPEMGHTASQQVPG